MQQLVGAKNSVPKEKVYPRLDALGALHLALAEERRAQVGLALFTHVILQSKHHLTTASMVVHVTNLTHPGVTTLRGGGVAARGG